MKCTKCGLREATTEVLQRHNNHIQKMYLCDECAAGYRPETLFDDFNMLNKLINGSPMGLVNSFDMFNAPQPGTLVCPDCKTTSAEFLRTGFVGCPHCYDVFEPLVIKTVKTLQQADSHVGKAPVGAIDYAKEEARLKGELQAAVNSADYVKVGEISKLLDRLHSEQNGRNDR